MFFLYNKKKLNTATAHSGQAADLFGLDHLMPKAIESGDNTLLVKRLESCHLMKTASPFGSIARIGANIGMPNKFIIIMFMVILILH